MLYLAMIWSNIICCYFLYTFVYKNIAALPPEQLSFRNIEDTSVEVLWGATLHPNANKYTVILNPRGSNAIKVRPQ